MVKQPGKRHRSRPDNTLADSKSRITDEMAGLLDRLLAKFQVCVISGGKFEQFETQLIDHLNVAPDKLAALHVMPTCGTRCYRFDVAAGAWQQVYAEDLPAVSRKPSASAPFLNTAGMFSMEKRNPPAADGS
jgi:phosphomannomutase